MESIYEIQRIKQVKMEVEVEGETTIIRCPEDAAALASKWIGEDDREVFFVMCLSTKNEVVAVHRAHIGSLNASVVHPRDAFKAAILNNSASLIVAHQHPSGNVDPSQEDIQVTKRLKEAGQMMGIEVLDSLVVCDQPTTYISLKEKGYL